MQMYLSPENVCFWGDRSLRSLAQYKYNLFVGTFRGLAPPPPPPQYQKAGYATGIHAISASFCYNNEP